MLNTTRTTIDTADAAPLEELEQSTQDAIIRGRAHVRLNIRSRIIVQSADQSRRTLPRLEGVTGDVSRGGCQLLLSAPLAVGDFFLLNFDRAVLDIPPTFARCIRARFIREDAFEAGLSFLNPIDLPSAVSAPQQNNVI